VQKGGAPMLRLQLRLNIAVRLSLKTLIAGLVLFWKKFFEKEPVLQPGLRNPDELTR
jgi:hypothetical protein